jgi:RNA polymerase sigma factor (sigma-70 family)
MDPPKALGDKDVEIALQMMDGDEDGLRELLRRFGPRVRGFLKSTYGDVLAEPELAEALNVAAYNVWRFARRYDETKGTLASWFVRIAQNAARNLLRGELRHTHKELEYDPGYDPASNNEGESEPSTEADPEAQQRVQDLEEGIEQLPPLQRAITKADLAAGAPADAGRLATIHGTSKNSIYVSRAKARESLRKHMIRRGHFKGTGRAVR